MKTKIHSLVFLLLTFLIFHFSFLIDANATIRYVSPIGNNIPPYLTWEDAANSIQDCIDVSEFGDTIYVANGVYEEQVVMINGLSLIGAGMDSCVISLQSTGIPAVQVVDSCILEGFKVVVPNTLNTWGIEGIGFGGLISSNKIVNASLGIYAGNSNITLYENIFENIKTRGIWIFNSNSIIRQNLIFLDLNSQASSPTGIFIQSPDNTYTPIIDSNYIETTSEGIRKSFGTRPTITNNTILVKRVGARGITLSTSDSAYVYNNLIITDAGFRGIQNGATQYLSIFNNYLIGRFNYGIVAGPDNIVKHNVVTDAINGVDVFGTENLIFQYNNIWNNNLNYSGFTPDSTNLSVDPMIVNDDTTQGELDFHLQMFSPLIDAGDPEMFDKDGSRIDIGLYGGLYGERYKYLDLPPRPPRNLTGEIDTGFITIRWNPNTEADFNHYKLFRDTSAGFTADSATFVLSLTDTFYTHIIPSGIKKYYYKLTAVDNQGNESQPSEELAVIVTSVNADEPGIISNYILYPNYPNPFNPSTTIGYKLKERGYVKLYVYSVTGELVSVLVNQYQEAGYYEVEFTLRNFSEGGLASGVYIYQIMVRNENNIPVFTDMKKMIYLK